MERSQEQDKSVKLLTAMDQRLWDKNDQFKLAYLARAIVRAEELDKQKTWWIYAFAAVALLEAALLLCRF